MASLWRKHIGRQSKFQLVLIVFNVKGMRENARSMSNLLENLIYKKFRYVPKG
jgi:hypothetical protein